MSIVEPTPEPSLPTPPSDWSPGNIVTYSISLAMFIVGLLTQMGVVLPAHTTSDIQIWGGFATELAALVTSVLNTVHQRSVKFKYASLRYSHS